MRPKISTPLSFTRRLRKSDWPSGALRLQCGFAYVACMSKRDAQITLRLSEPLRRELDREAAESGLLLAELIRAILIEDVAARLRGRYGDLPENPAEAGRT